MDQFTEITREELIKYMRKELICTIGSADAPMTIPVLITTFREDTEQDVEQLANKLNFSSIKALLESEEFSNTIEPCWTDLAKGAGNKNPRKVHCYKVKPRADIDHILTAIEGSLTKEQKKINEIKALIENPQFKLQSLYGKEKILYCLDSLGAQAEAIPLLVLQNKYKEEYGVEMDKAELKKSFRTGRISSVFSDFMPNDVEMHAEKDKPGALHFKMKKSLAEVRAEIAEIERQNKEAEKLEALAKRKRLGKKIKMNGPKQLPPQPPKLKKIKPPPKLTVIVPPVPKPQQLPKPKPIPILVKKGGQKIEKFYTDQADLAMNVKSAAAMPLRENLENGDGGDSVAIGNALANAQFDEFDELTDRTNLEAMATKKKAKKTKYTSMVEGAEATDSEAGDLDEEEDENYGWKLAEKGPSPDANCGGTSTSNNSPNDGNNDDAIEIEKLKQLELARKTVVDHLKSAAEHKARFMRAAEIEVFDEDNPESKKGIFKPTVRTGRRAKAEAERKERVSKLLAKLEAKWEAEGKSEKTMVVSQKSEEKQVLIAALLSQMIWAHGQIGISEVKQMLRLLFFNSYSDIEMDVEKFVKERIKIAKLVRGPEEVHIEITKPGSILKATAGYRRARIQNQQQQGMVQ